MENASLLPWLTATALLHTTLAGRRRLTGWTVVLACDSFLLVCIGTFLTRSGALASVHVFASSPIGPLLLGFVLLVVAATTGVGLWRAGRLDAPRPLGRPLSRETALVANAVGFVTLTAIVLTGTLFPLVSDALTGVRTAVGPPYFNRTALPVALVVLVAMAVGPPLRPGRDEPGPLARRLAAPTAVGLATVTAVGLLSRPDPMVLAALGVAGFALAATGRRAALVRRRAAHGGLIAHAGITLAVVGIAVSSGYTASVERQLGLGEQVTVGGVTARLTRVNRGGGDTATTAVLRLERHGRHLATSRPGLCYDPAHDMTVGRPAIRSRPTGDVYATLTGVDEDGTTATVRLAANPAVGLVWAGGALTALGGLLALGRRQRPTRGDGRAVTTVPAGAR